MSTRALLVALTFCSAAQVAHAERLGIFVRITDSDERPTGIDQLALLEQLASRAEFAKGLTVVRASEVLTSDVRRAVIGCGEKLECIASKLTATEIDLGLLATIDASSDPALVLVLLIDAKTGKLLGRALEEASRSESDSIAHFAELNALRLLESAGHPLGGRAIVRAVPADAAIVARGGGGSGDVRAKSEEKTALAPGVWTIEVSKEGFAAKTVQLDIAAGKDSEVAVSLEESSSVLASPWLWIAIGAIAAGAAITAFAVTRPNEGPPLIPGDDGRIIMTLRPGE